MSVGRGSWYFAALILACASQASAQTESAEPEAAQAEPVVDVHAFVSQGLIKSTANNFLASSERGSLEFAEVGINFSKSLTDKLRLGLQLFARDLGPVGNYTPQVDWFFLDYHFRDWLGLRAGRTKLPFGLYNETSDIDAARVPILLPQSIYPVQNRDLLLAQTGAELYGIVPLQKAGDLEYRAYGGTVFLDTSDADAVSKFEVPYLFGGRLMWLTPLEGLQAGGSLQKLKLDLDYAAPPEAVAPLQAAGVLPPDFDGTVHVHLPALLWVASIEYAAHDLLLAAEYSQWDTDLQSSAPVLLPESALTSELYYVMGSYRVTPWFTPGVYYSTKYPDMKDRKGRESYQNDVALTARFDVNSNWLVKLEGHYMHGTAGLDSALNDNKPLNTLEKDWGVFLAKTTAYF